MKLRSKQLTNLGGLAATTLIRNWMRTLDYKAALYDPAVDPVDSRCQVRALYLFWHEYILFPLYLRGRNNLTMLMSKHRDADLLSRLAFHFGFGFVRGSTARGGDRAIRELVRQGEVSHLTITPDGPRGPRRQMAPGPIYLASKTGMPLVLMGLGYDRPWRAPTWDRFAIPRPGTRARAVVSQHIYLPPDLSRSGIEHYRRRMEQFLLRLTHEAEAWAEAGTPKQGEFTPRPGPPLSSTIGALETWWRGEPSIATPDEPTPIERPARAA